MTKEKLISEARVEEIFDETFIDEFKDGSTHDSLIGIGIVMDYEFSREKLSAQKAEIKQMLLNLPQSFMESNGICGSYLNACRTKDDVQWTALPRTLEKFIAMGKALNLVDYTQPKKEWSSLPGGFPNIFVKDIEEK